MTKAWAVILDGLVENTVYASDEDVKDLKYTWIDITNTLVGVNWTTQDNKTFVSPDGQTTVTLNG